MHIALIKKGEKQDFTILQYCYLKENTLHHFFIIFRIT